MYNVMGLILAGKGKAATFIVVEILRTWGPAMQDPYKVVM